MNWEAVGALAEAFGAVAVVVSLVYLAAEVRRSTRQGRLDAQRDLVGEFGRLSQSLACDRQLACLLRDGSERFDELDPVQRVQFRSYLNHLFKLFEQQHLLYLEESADPQMWSAVQAMMDDSLATQGCRRWWDERAEYHTRRFQELVGQRSRGLWAAGPDSSRSSAVSNAAAADLFPALEPDDRDRALAAARGDQPHCVGQRMRAHPTIENVEAPPVLDIVGPQVPS